MKIDKKSFFIFLTILTATVLTGSIVNPTFANDSDFNPMVYDTNNDKSIEMDEVVPAINDYRWNEISRTEVVEVFRVYFDV